MHKQAVFISFLVTAIAALAQKAKVELVIEPTHVEVGESIRITITSSVDGTMEIENLPSSFVQDYAISQGSQDKINYNTGEVETLYFYSYSGVITKAGKYTVGPVYIKNLNKVYPSNKVTITVDPKSTSGSSGQISKKQLNDPAFGVIAASKTELYEGEPLVLTAKIYSHYNPSHISGYNSYNVPGTVTKYPIGNPNNIKVGIEKVQGAELYAFDYDKNVVFPAGVGKFTIEPYQLNLHQGYKSFPINSGSLSIHIKPLPSSAPVSFIGAVGSMTFESEIDTSRIKQGNVFTYTLTVKGAGNLGNIKEPRLSLPKGFIVYGDPEREDHFSVGIHGAEGEVRFKYHIQVVTHGKFDIPQTELSYFDPKKESYITLKTNVLAISIDKDPSITTRPDESNTPDLTAEDDEPSENTSGKQHNQLPWKDILVVGIPILSLAGIFFLILRGIKTRAGHNPAPTVLNTNIDHKSEIKSSFSEASKLVNSNHNEFLTAVQHTINLLFLQLSNEESGMVSNNEMKEILFKTGNESHLERLEQLMEIITHSKYGMAQANIDNQEILAQLDILVKGLLS